MKGLSRSVRCDCAAAFSADFSGAKASRIDTWGRAPLRWTAGAEAGAGGRLMERRFLTAVADAGVMGMSVGMPVGRLFLTAVTSTGAGAGMLAGVIGCRPAGSRVSPSPSPASESGEGLCSWHSLMSSSSMRKVFDEAVRYSMSASLHRLMAE